MVALHGDNTLLWNMVTSHESTHGCVTWMHHGNNTWLHHEGRNLQVKSTWMHQMETTHGCITPLGRNTRSYHMVASHGTTG